MTPCAPQEPFFTINSCSSRSASGGSEIAGGRAVGKSAIGAIGGTGDADGATSDGIIGIGCTNGSGTGTDAAETGAGDVAGHIFCALGVLLSSRASAARAGADT